MASILFVYPPTADPTGPYLSIPYLAAACRSRGHRPCAVDLNLAGWRDLLTESRLREAAEIGRRRFDALPSDGLDHDDARLYLRLALALHDAEEVAAGVKDAVETLRDPARFFDPAAYDDAVHLLERALALVAARHDPLELSFTRYAGPFLLGDADEIRRDAHPDRNPFAPSYEAHLDPALDRERPDVIGLSATFNAQLQQTFAIGAHAKRRAPDVPVIAGGTAITQLVLRSEPAALARLAPFLDAIVLFEGEETLAELLDRVDRGEDWRALDNVVRLDGDEARWTSRPTSVSLDAWPAPDYGVLPVDEYLSPEPFLYVAPTRGCYWEKCAFCHYGLTDHGTAPYRKRDPARFVDDLAALEREHGARFFYFAGDLIDPRYLLDVSERILARGLDVRFTSDLRIERSFSAERCRTLRRAGLVAAAFGTESDSPRLLELMEKGTDPSANRRVFENFAGAGVAVQAMTFVDFPTETAAEAHATLDLIDECRDRIDLFFVERFDLEAGSRVFREPEAYDIAEVFYPEGDDYRLRARFVPRSATKAPREVEQLVRRVDDLCARYGRRPYPFAGAVSVAHTLLWFDRHGRDVFKRLAAEASARPRNGAPGPAPDARLALAPGCRLADLPYDLEELADHFSDATATVEQRREFELRDVGREAYRALSREVPTFPASETTYLLPRLGTPIRIPDWVWRLVSCLDGTTTVAEAADAIDLPRRQASDAIDALARCGYLEPAGDAP